MGNFLRKIIPTKNDRELKRYRPIVAQINELEPKMKALTDADLQHKTIELREKFDNAYKALGGDPSLKVTPEIRDKDQRKKELLILNKALNVILPEAFAVTREAGRRVLEMRHFDVQLIGGLCLHEGRIAEMKTGEGKTLVATLPLYLNALAGRGVHLVTVNEYLAQRDAEWMGQIYRFLGLDVGIIINGLSDSQRQAAYGADITYGTNSEFGFDYLRDNMKFRYSDYVQRGHHFAIVDEVDSILIDEARTPLIISGPAEESTDLYVRINGVVPGLKKELDYTIDEKARTVSLTENGVATLEKRLGVNNLYDPNNIMILHHVNQALKAHTLFKRDVDYLVENGEVKIIDEHTGRVLDGRRWSDGLHQAVEAKEEVKIQNENQTLATVTYQNYFRMYLKLGGMTGTAMTEAEEFAKIYDLEVIEIPTNRPQKRIDYDDIILGTEREKFKLIIEEIIAAHKKGQPVLVGTISVEKSEVLARMLARQGIPHTVLNAKYHKQEAAIVAQAGRKGAVTISTNMAGRGTDIVLGGNPEFMARAEVNPDEDPEGYAKALAKYKEQCAKEREEVMAAGGLYILGTERHESRRIDNQLRGRAGRQGDPGCSRFYLSLEDNLMRVFGGEKMKTIMETFGLKEGEIIEHRMVSKSVERAQRNVEGYNFDMRKHLLDYDDVMNQQRHAIYGLRLKVLRADDAATKELVLDLIEEAVINIVAGAAGNHGGHSEEWDIAGLKGMVKDLFDVTLSDEELNNIEKRDDLELYIFNKVEEYYNKRESEVPAQALHHVERMIYLSAIDSFWKEHLGNMEQLKDGIGLRGYAQKDPKQEYIKEGRNLFTGMIEGLTTDVLNKFFHIRFTVESEEEMARKEEEARERQRRMLRMGPARPQTADAPRAAAPAQGGRRPPQDEGRPVTVRRQHPKIGRNDPCYCGSGKKYKNCCLEKDEAAGM